MKPASARWRLSRPGSPLAIALGLGRGQGLRTLATYGGRRLATLALDVTGYSATVNDGFTSGFPTNPPPDTSGSFVGAAYDWSGAAWSTSADVPAPGFYNGFAMLGPRHALVARHVYTVNDDPRICGRDGVVSNREDTALTNLGYGFPSSRPDLAVATLAAPLTTPDNMARYAMLDLNDSSSAPTPENHGGVAALAYGRGGTTTGSPRVGTAITTDAGTWTGKRSRTNWTPARRSHGTTSPDGNGARRRSRGCGGRADEGPSGGGQGVASAALIGCLIRR